MNQQVLDHLKVLAAKNNGNITPELVIEDAKRPESPLHHLFEWDLKKAAYQAWLYRAREIIRGVTVQVSQDTIVLRAPMFVHNPNLPEGEQGYSELSSLKRKRSDAMLTLEQEVQRIASAIARAKSVAAQLGLEAELSSQLATMFGEQKQSKKKAA